MNWMQTIDSTWTLFLDRDGVINKRPWNDYVKTIEEFEFLPGVLQAFRQFSALFSHIVVVTNQQGIGKNVMTVADLEEIHQFMINEITANDGKLSACFFAPELKTDPSHTRKPLPNMAIKAKEQLPEIDFAKSIMVGDTDSDILFGKNLGMKTVRIVTDEPINVIADYNVTSLLELAELWKK